MTIYDLNNNQYHVPGKSPQFQTSSRLSESNTNGYTEKLWIHYILGQYPQDQSVQPTLVPTGL